MTGFEVNVWSPVVLLEDFIEPPARENLITLSPNIATIVLTGLANLRQELSQTIVFGK